MTLLDFVIAGVVVVFIVVSSPWFLAWLFERGWRKQESKRWREKFLKGRP
jgi:hypothetical protein